jgi:hypothetical protein
LLEAVDGVPVGRLDQVFRAGGAVLRRPGAEEWIGEIGRCGGIVGSDHPATIRSDQRGQPIEGNETSPFVRGLVQGAIAAHLAAPEGEEPACLVRDIAAGVGEDKIEGWTAPGTQRFPSFINCPGSGEIEH